MDELARGFVVFTIKAILVVGCAGFWFFLLACVIAALRGVLEEGE